MPSGVLTLLMILTAGAAAWLVSRPAVPAGRPGPVRSLAAFLVTALACLLGGSWFHFLFDRLPAGVAIPWWSIVLPDPLRTGKVLYGAIALYPVGIRLAAWIERGYWLAMLDRRAHILFAGLGLHRIHCLVNGCCHGVPSDLFGIVYRAGSPAAREHFQRGLVTLPGMPSLPVLPVQGLEAVALLGCAWHAWAGARAGRAGGFASATVIYAGSRFLLEFFRDDLERQVWAGLSASQWLSLTILAAAAVWFLRRRVRSGPEAP